MKKIKRAKKLHKEDRKIAIGFIDYVRLRKTLNVKLEINARYLCKYLGINPNQPNYKISNIFAHKMETGAIQ